MYSDLLAGSTFVGAVAMVAEVTVHDAVLVALTLTDEVEDDLHLLCESQGLYLDRLRLALLWTGLGCHTDAEYHLTERKYMRDLV